MAKMEWKVDQSFMQPNWAAEAIGPQNMIPGGARLDMEQFPYSDSFRLTAKAGAVTAGAAKTINVVDPLKGNIPAGYILDFGGGKYAKLTKRAMKGEMSIVADLTTALAGGEVATFGGVSGGRIVRGGTLVGRTYAELDAGMGFGPAAATDDEIYLLAFDTQTAIDMELAGSDVGCELLRHQSLVRDHLLPGWNDLSADLKAKVRSLYQCVRGNGNI